MPHHVGPCDAAETKGAADSASRVDNMAVGNYGRERCLATSVRCVEFVVHLSVASRASLETVHLRLADAVVKNGGGRELDGMYTVQRRIRFSL